MKAILFLFLIYICFAQNPIINNNRPPPNQRKFKSEIVEQTINQIVPKMIDQDLALLFVDCFPNTLDTTIDFSMNSNGPDTFVITGDIPAMWLRDSSAQVFVYVPFATQDSHLQDMIRGVIRRQAYNINIDVYANAFNNASSGSPWDKDKRVPPMSPWLWEGKYELDSLGWVLRLSTYYYNVTGDDSICTSDWFYAMSRILEAITYQQKSIYKMKPTDKWYYSFARTTDSQIDTLLQPMGVPNNECGLSRGCFRPSDDAQRLPYQVASNALVSVALADLGKMLSDKNHCYNLALSNTATTLSKQIKNAIMTNAVVTHPTLGKVFAYEVDCFGSHLLMDDPNIPNLAGLPRLGFISLDDPLYTNTRNMIYSTKNPYYFCGSAGCGVGSPHTGTNRIWPMGLLNKALTSQSDSEIVEILNILKSTTDNTFFMHESFNVSNPKDYTRSWFSWANGLYGELILKLAKERPHIIFGPSDNK